MRETRRSVNRSTATRPKHGLKLRSGRGFRHGLGLRPGLWRAGRMSTSRHALGHRIRLRTRQSRTVAQKRGYVRILECRRTVTVTKVAPTIRMVRRRSRCALFTEYQTTSCVSKVAHTIDMASAWKRCALITECRASVIGRSGAQTTTVARPRIDNLRPASVAIPRVPRSQTRQSPAQ